MADSDPMAAAILRLLSRHPEVLTPIAAGILVAAYAEYAHDSRSFSRKLGVAHALVIRECSTLAHDLGLVRLEDRKERSQRVFYALTDRGRDMVEEAS
ncbi:MAG: hypothetical protein AAGC70_04540 [Pseudomonadota bacterium]